MSDISNQSNRGCEVTIQSVSKSYGTKKVLADINMTIEPGEFFTLLGPSGCGKTTLLRAIAGFHPITAGRILFDGTDIGGRPPWERNIGFVFQNYALWPNKTVFDNIAFGLRLRKVPKSEVGERVRAVLAQVELKNVEDRYPSEMSGGMQQRIALARALVIDPPLLLLDEPMSNLDARLRISLRRELRDLQKRIGLTAIYVTHDQEEALELSDRIAVMKDGLVQQLSAPEQIYAEPQNRFVAEFVGNANFINGQWTEGGFKIDSGTVLPLQSSDAGKSATLFVRPERVQVRPEGEGLCNAVVEGRRYIGRSWSHRLRINGGPVIVAETGSRIDDGVSVGFDNPTFLEASS